VAQSHNALHSRDVLADGHRFRPSLSIRRAIVTSSVTINGRPADTPRAGPEAERNAGTVSSRTSACRLPPERDSTTIGSAVSRGNERGKADGGLLTDLPCRSTRRMLRLAIQGSSREKGDDVEESQLRVSAVIAARTSTWSSGPPELWQRASSPYRLWESRDRSPSATALHGVRRVALGTGPLESLRAV
jgi:hypothetical protein